MALIYPDERMRLGSKNVDVSCGELAQFATRYGPYQKRRITLAGRQQREMLPIWRPFGLTQARAIGIAVREIARRLARSGLHPHIRVAADSGHVPADWKTSQRVIGARSEERECAPIRSNFDRSRARYGRAVA